MSPRLHGYVVGLRMMCQCRGRHHQLRGYSRTHKKSWTAVAEPYPRGLCRLLSIALCCKAGWCDQRKLNVAGCARLKNLRPGEAQNPGPRKRKSQSLPPRPTLEELPGILPATLQMESKLLREFLRWCEASIRSASPSEIFDRVPSCLGTTLRSYGDLCFQSHGSLSNFRHLILNLSLPTLETQLPTLYFYCLGAGEEMGDSRACHIGLQLLRPLSNQSARRLGTMAGMNGWASPSSLSTVLAGWERLFVAEDQTLSCCLILVKKASRVSFYSCGPSNLCFVSLGGYNI